MQTQKPWLRRQHGLQRRQRQPLGLSALVLAAAVAAAVLLSALLLLAVLLHGGAVLGPCL